MTRALLPVAKLPDGATAAPAKVTLWLKPSELVQVTVAPDATLIAAGLNARFFMSTDVVATGPPPPPPPPPVVTGPVLSEPPPQAARNAVRDRIIRRVRIGTPCV